MTGTLASLRDLLKNGQLERVLGQVSELFERLSNDGGFRGTSFPFPAFDALCEEIGRASAFELFSPNVAHVEEDHELVILTEVTVQGGHAEIIGDIADCGDLPLVIAPTNLYSRKHPLLSTIEDHPRVLKVIRFDGATMLPRLRALQGLIANPKAKRIHVLCHGHDAVAVAAVAPVADKPVLFFHHCDHSPTLGCFLRSATHVDLHNLALQHCCSDLGIEARYICLTSRDGPAIPSSRAYAKPVFKSATCGGEHKLRGMTYAISYADVVCRVVAAHKGVHFHVGVLSSEFLAAIKGALRHAALPEEAFVHVGHVSGFREILEALEVDLYIPTLPYSGGKALIDAMSAGVPILAHVNAVGRLWGGRDLVYPEAPSWSNLEELDDCLELFQATDYWREQSSASRAYFERYHSRPLFTEMLRAGGVMAGAGLPPLKPYRPDFDEVLKVRG